MVKNLVLIVLLEILVRITRVDDVVESLVFMREAVAMKLGISLSIGDRSIHIF